MENSFEAKQGEDDAATLFVNRAIEVDKSSALKAVADDDADLFLWLVVDFFSTCRDRIFL